MSTGFRLTSPMHLRRPLDFERVYKGGGRAGDGHLLVFAFRNGMANNRVGLSVSKKHGSAVRRNRKRRLLKEAFRLLQHEIPAGMDIILIPRQRDDSTLTDFLLSLKTLVIRLARQFSRAQVSGAQVSGAQVSGAEISGAEISGAEGSPD